MLTVIVLSIVVPSVAAAAFMALRRRLPIPVADRRGIALQTIIIMVVLLAIAGAVAAVLITRGRHRDRPPHRPGGRILNDRPGGRHHP